MKTKFATLTNPWTGKKEIEFVPIPKVSVKRKGYTGQDDVFDKMIKDKIAIEVHESKFDAMRRCCQRYVSNRQISDKYMVRQAKNGASYTLWFEDK